jgi:hypothetical protein
MPIEDYSHMMVEMKLMVDGDEGGEDDDEGGLQSLPPGEKSWIDLTSESKIVALAALRFANSLPLGHPVFVIYEGVRERWRRGGARGPNEQAPRDRESSCVSHARLGLEHSLVSFQFSNSSFT